MKPLIIVSNSRTGTNFLRSSINNHPHIRCHPELFNLQDKTRKKIHMRFFKNDKYIEKIQKEVGIEYLEKTIWPEVQENKRYGFKILLDQITRWDLWEYLESIECYYLLLIRNPLVRFVSGLQARETGLWHRLKDEKLQNAPPVKIDLTELYSFVSTTILWESRVIQNFKRLYIVRYKDMLNEYDNVMKKVFEFLEVSNYNNPISDYKKQQSCSFEKRIKNFEYLKKNLKNEYLYLLNDLF